MCYKAWEYVVFIHSKLFKLFYQRWPLLNLMLPKKVLFNRSSLKYDYLLRFNTYIWKNVKNGCSIIVFKIYNVFNLCFRKSLNGLNYWYDPTFPRARLNFQSLYYEALRFFYILEMRFPLSVTGDTKVIMGQSCSFSEVTGHNSWWFSCHLYLSL